MIIVTQSFSKSSVLKIFSLHLKRKAGGFKFLQFEKLRTCDGLEWTVEMRCIFKFLCRSVEEDIEQADVD